MERYKSKFVEETPAPATDAPMGTSQKLATGPQQTPTGNLKAAAVENKDDKAAKADLSNSPSKLFKPLVGKTVFDPKNKVMLVIGEQGIQIGNIQTNKILADLSYADLKFKT